MSNPHNAALPIASAALCCFCAGSLYGWSALIPIVEINLADTTAKAGLIFSLAIVSFTASVFIAPRSPPCLRKLPGCALYSLVAAVCLWLASGSTTYTYFVFCFSVGFGMASGAIYINALSIASESKHPNIATPVMVACFGLGGAVFGPLWRLLAAQGWDMRALLPVSVLLILSAALAIAVWFTHDQQANNAGTTKSGLAEHQSMTSRQSRLIALIFLTFGLGSMGGLMVLGLASKLVDVAGGTVLLSTIVLAGVAIGNTSGRLSVSFITLRFTSEQSVFTATLVTSIGLTIMTLALIGSAKPVLLSTGLIVVALGYGILASAIPTLVRAIVAESQFARVFSIVFFAWGFAGLTAPWVAGLMFDRLGSFVHAVVSALLFTLLAMITTRMIASHTDASRTKQNS